MAEISGGVVPHNSRKLEVKKCYKKKNPEFCFICGSIVEDYSKYPLATVQENTLHMDITRWLILKSD